MDLAPSVGIFYPRPVPIRSAQRWSSRRGTGRGGPQRCRASQRVDKVGVCGSLILPKAGGARPRRNGRTARVNVRASARTNGERGRHLLTLGHLSKPTNPSACGTQAKGCFRGPGSVLATSLAGSDHRSCAVTFQRCAGCSAGYRAGRGSGLLPTRSAPPLLGEQGTGMKRLALWPK